MSTTFKIGDRVVLVKDRDSARKGMKGTVVTELSAGDYGVKFDEKFDEGHSLDGSCDMGYGYWIAPDEMELIPSLKVGQIYRVGDIDDREGNLIKITSANNSNFSYITIRGTDWHHNANNGSIFSDSLAILTGSQIGEAIRKWDEEHAEKKSGVREVKRHAEPGEYVKLIESQSEPHYKNGDIVPIINYTYFGNDHARYGKNAGDFFYDEEYVVLEGYKPEQPKAKVGDTIKVLRNNGGPVKAGTVWTVDKIGNMGLTVHNSDYPTAIWSINLDNYTVISSGKHAYTAEQVERAKQIVLDTIRGLAEKDEQIIINHGDGIDKDSAFDACIIHHDTDVFSYPLSNGNRRTSFTSEYAESKCSPNDEPNEWIGKCVALCKVLHKPIPKFITEG